LKKFESGILIADILRMLRIGQSTFYKEALGAIRL